MNPLKEKSYVLYTLLYKKYITTTDLLYLQGTLLNTLITYKGKECKKEWINVYV